MVPDATILLVTDRRGDKERWSLPRSREGFRYGIIYKEHPQNFWDLGNLPSLGLIRSKFMKTPFLISTFGTPQCERTSFMSAPTHVCMFAFPLPSPTFSQSAHAAPSPPSPIRPSGTLRHSVSALAPQWDFQIKDASERVCTHSMSVECFRR